MRKASCLVDEGSQDIKGFESNNFILQSEANIGDSQPLFHQ